MGSPNLQQSTNADVLTGGDDFGCIVGGTVNEPVGFYGNAGLPQQSSSGVTTVAEVLTLLKNLGLLS